MNKKLKFIFLNIIIVSFTYAAPEKTIKATKVVQPKPTIIQQNPTAAQQIIAQHVPTQTPNPNPVVETNKPAIAKPTEVAATQPESAKPTIIQETAKTIQTMPIVPGIAAPIKPEVTSASKCDTNQVFHNNICAYCPSDATYNKDTNKCVCNNANELIGQGTTTDNNKTYFQCINCPANLIPNKEKTKCICADFETSKHDLNCNNYSTNQVRHNRKDGTYSCNEADHVLSFDKKNNLIKCYTCPSDAKYDKDNNVCICTKPDAKNKAHIIEYAPVVEDDKLVCNPNI